METINVSASVSVSSKFLITDAMKEEFMSFFPFMIMVVALFGCATNTTVTVVFYRMGLKTSTNISFFSLAIADLVNLGWIFLFYIYPYVDDSRLHLSMYTISTHITSPVGYAASSFGSWVTAVINLERCCCVVLPLKVKQIFSKKTVIALLLFMAVYEVATTTPFYVGVRLKAVTITETNWTQLVRDNANMDTELMLLSRFLSTSAPNLICFILILLGTIFLIQSFKRSVEKRKSMSAGSTDKDGAAKERRIVKAVILICALYIFGYFIDIVKYIASLGYPQIHVRDPYLGNFTSMLTSLGYLCKAISCAVNIFVYLKLNSGFREMFANLIHCKHQK